MPVRLLSFFVLVLISVSAYAQHEATTFILVRHAEKEAAGSDQMMAKDPPLSKAGQERALRLQQMLEKQPLTLILSTNYDRTKSTVKPLADAKGMKVEIYESLKAPQLDEIISRNRGGTVLICGHSNTIPSLANLLAGTSFSNFEDSDYGNIFIITVTTVGKGSVTHVRY